MSREERFESALDGLVRFLSAPAFVTAKAIAEEFSCSKVTVYKRLQVLQARGYAFEVKDVREGVTGPLSTAYKIKRGEGWRSIWMCLRKA